MSKLLCAAVVSLTVTILVAASGPAGSRGDRDLAAGRGGVAAGVGPTTIFVDQGANGADDGTSWGDAHLDLQDALDQAGGLGGAVEIHVAEGTYRPDRGSGARAETFQLHDGVKLLGGFPSGGSDRAGRDPAEHATILSGDLAGNDAGIDCVGAEENSLNVVSAEGVGVTAWVDGFTITGGNPSQGMLCEEGGGLFIEAANPTITNCIIVNNCACTKGGGAYVWNGAGTSAPTFINCVFNGNEANEGGAMYVDSGTVTMTNCTIAQNHANLFTGGVIVDGFGAGLTVTNTILWDNDTAGIMNQAAQIVAGPGSTLSMNYCVVQGWIGTLGGVGNNGDDPLFADPDGDDLLVGSADDNLRLSCGSSGIDSGDNGALPPDTCDLDSDGDTAEAFPIDLDHLNRFVNNVTPDTGVGIPPIVDRGAYELLGILDPDCPGDVNGDFEIDVDDLIEVIAQWDCVAPPACSADVFGDCVVNVNDLQIIISGWGACPVDNDECVDRVDLNLGPNVFHNQSATTNPGDPAFPCGSNPGNDVWFNYTAPCAGTLTVDTCGSEFDTVVAIYNGASCPPGALLGCNDNAGAGTACPGTPQSSVSIAVGTGQTVKIRVGGADGARGLGTLNLAVTDSDNDECVCATPIAPGQVLTVNTTGSTFDFSPPPCPFGAPDFNGGSVWLRTIGTGNDFKLVLCGDPLFSFDSRLNVYIGPCADLQCAADEPFDNAPCEVFTEELCWSTAPGTEYLIMIHGNGVTGTVEVTLTEESCP